MNYNASRSSSILAFSLLYGIFFESALNAPRGMYIISILFAGLFLFLTAFRIKLINYVASFFAGFISLLLFTVAESGLRTPSNGFFAHVIIILLFFIAIMYVSETKSARF